MNFFNVNLGGIRNTLASFNFINVSFSGKYSRGQVVSEVENSKVIEPIEKIIYKDTKTVLAGSDKSLVKNIADDVIVYLFIAKEKQAGNAWNTVVPVILEKSTRRFHQYGRGYFALEGSGGGLSNTTCLLNYLKLHKKKGFSVDFLPFVTDENYLNGFEYVDSGIGLAKLEVESTELSLYRKREFIHIYNKFKQLMTEYNL